MSIATQHSLERTSLKGGPFIGRCVLCGATDLTMASMNDWCPNTVGKTQDQALIDAIEGPKEQIK